MRRAGLYGLFFLSGASALTYELVWQRLLHLVFGVSTLSVSAVLAAFMGGLALGGLLFGRLADRTTRPLRLYAWLEAGIGASALLIPPGFAVLTSLYTHLYAMLEPGYWGGAGLRLALALLVLAGPSTLIGATMPVMGRLACSPPTSLRRPGPARHLGVPCTFSLLYAANTLGAVLGAALTGFLLLRVLGMRQTLALAAGLNFLTALAAGWSSRRPAWQSQDSPGESSSPGCPTGASASPRCPTPTLSPSHSPTLSQRTPWLALGCALVTGAVGMAFEVAWTRILGILTSNSAYGFALVLTVLLLGLAVGSLLQAGWSRRPGDPWGRLALCQWLLAGATLATVPFFHTSPDWFVGWCMRAGPPEGWGGQIFLGELALTAGALFLPAVFMGMALPLLVAAAADPGRLGHGLGRLYAANALGSVIGPFLAGFVLIPWLGIRATLGLCIVGPVLVGLAAWSMALRPTGTWRTLAGGLVLLAAAAGWWLLPSGVYHKSSVREPRRLLYYQEGDNATVAVVEEANHTRSIMVDGQPIAGTSGTSVVDQKMLAHLPLLLHPAPARALTVGFGSGGTSHSMTLHGIDVDCVEIEARVPAAAPLFRSENHDVRAHPRFRLILDDARSWLRVAPVSYDVIVTDCTNIQYRSNGDLYTVDYFRLLKERLAEGGLAAAWVPANGIREEDLRTLLRSFRAVFPHTSVWYMNTLPTDFLIVVGTPGPLEIDLDRLRRRMGRPEVAEDLAVVGLEDPCRLVYTFLAEDRLADYLGAGPLNTDDRPVLSYTTYGAAYRETIADNLLDLLACRTDVARLVSHPVPGAALLRHYAASNEVLLGHILYHLGFPQAALAHYRAAARLLPQDRTLPGLMR